MADAAYAIVTQDARQCTGQFLLDEEVLRGQGQDDFSDYMIDPSLQPIPDFYID